MLLKSIWTMFGPKAPPQSSPNIPTEPTSDASDAPNDDNTIVDDEPPGSDLLSPPSKDDINPMNKYCWILDAGHGSLTVGKRSPIFPELGERLYEYKFNRSIVSLMSNMLFTAGIAHLVLVPETKVDNFLAGRVQRANNFSHELPKIFVSVHGNAAPAPPNRFCSNTIHGIETWHHSKSATGKKLAKVFQHFLVTETGWRDRGTKYRTSQEFYVLRHTTMPALLTENGFYNNHQEGLKMMDSEWQYKIAKAHVDAIKYIEANW